MSGNLQREGGSSTHNSKQSAAKPSRKRAQYTRHACTLCKASKVRCDGQLPCAFCAARGGAICSYSAPALPGFQVRDRRPVDDEAKFQTDVRTLLRRQNEQLELLLKRTASSEASAQNLPNGNHPAEHNKPTLPLFQSSTSAFFWINVADAGGKAGVRHDLSKTMEASQQTQPWRPASFSIYEGEMIESETSDMPRCHWDDKDERPPVGNMRRQGGPPSVPAEPLDELESEAIIRIVKTYDQLESPLYPLVDISDLLERTQIFLSFRLRPVPERGRLIPSSQEWDTEHLAILKLVVAIGMLAEGDHWADMSSRLFKSLRPLLEAYVWSTEVDLTDLVVMTLATLYYFHRGTWRLGWRFLGNVIRIVLELGLNSEIVLLRLFPDTQTRGRAINTIWTIFVLERQLSYGLGLWKATQSLRLGPNFPPPVRAPWLDTMIDYASMGETVCDAFLGERSAGGMQQRGSLQDSFALFQYRLESWKTRVACDYSAPDANDESSPAHQMIRTILGLRANHIRILAARGQLSSAFRSIAPLETWSTTVDVAAETIQVLSQLDTGSKEYRFHQAKLNHMLTSALDILLFALTTGAASASGPTSVVGRVKITLSEESYMKARQASMVAMSLLKSQAENARHPKYLFERMRLVVSRLNLSEYLLQTTPSPQKTKPNEPSIVRNERTEPANYWPLPALENGSNKQLLEFQFDDTAIWDFTGALGSTDFDFPPELGRTIDNAWLAGQVPSFDGSFLVNADA